MHMFSASSIFIINACLWKTLRAILLFQLITFLSSYTETILSLWQCKHVKELIRLDVLVAMCGMNVHARSPPRGQHPVG